jgi:hypothetical protein
MFVKGRSFAEDLNFAKELSSAKAGELLEGPGNCSEDQGFVRRARNLFEGPKNGSQDKVGLSVNNLS